MGRDLLTFQTISDLVKLGFLRDELPLQTIHLFAVDFKLGREVFYGGKSFGTIVTILFTDQLSTLTISRDLPQ